MSSFQSPLLASLKKRPGAEDTPPQSPNAPEEDFIRRRRTPGGAERPLNRAPIFGNNNAPHRPSPLGMTQPTIAPAPPTLAANPQTTTTGTNFKARLLALQRGSNAPVTNGITTSNVWTRGGSSGGLNSARPDQLAPVGLAPRISPAAVAVTPAGISSPHFPLDHLMRSTSRGSTTMAPPVSSLEDDLLNMQLEEQNHSSNFDEASNISSFTPMKGSDTIENSIDGGSGIFNSIQQTPSTPNDGHIAVPGTETPMTSQTAFFSPYSTISASTKTPGPGLSPTFWTPILGSTTRKKGGKAFGVGALSVTRSGGIPSTIHKQGRGTPLDLTPTTTIAAGNRGPPRMENNTPAHQRVGHQHIDTSTSRFSSMIKKTKGDNGPAPISLSEEKTTSGEIATALSLQRRLRAELPDYLPGVSDWMPPESLQDMSTTSANNTSSAYRPAKPIKSSMSGGDALKELASLRNAALSKLETGSTRATRLMTPGGRISIDDQSYQFNNEKDGGFAACRGFSPAFAAAINNQDRDISNSITEKRPSFASPASSAVVSSPTATSFSLSLGDKVSPQGKGRARKQVILASGVEERFERLRLLREQATKIK